jgi:nucleoid-associated protein YgaU
MGLSRTGWILTLLAGASVWWLLPDVPALVAALAGTDFPRALAAAGALLQLAIAAWVLLVVASEVLVGPTPFAPALLRRALFVGAAAALAVAPAHADVPPDSGRDLPSYGVAMDALAGLRLPDRPDAPAETAGVETSPDPDAGHAVVVRPGDTLWAIARDALPAGASDADVATACARWHEANRDVIGPDPDLIFPDQRLSPPGKDSP